MTATLFAASRDELQQLVGEVWTSHLHEADALVAVPPHEWMDHSGEATLPCWSGAVSVTGEWHGMIAVDVADAAVDALARGMLAVGEDETLDPVELSDVVGEFANIVGGNVKSLMPGPSALSLPLVAHTLLEPPSELHPQLTLDLAWRGSPVRVRVLALPTSAQHIHLLESTS